MIFPRDSGEYLVPQIRCNIYMYKIYIYIYIQNIYIYISCFSEPALLHFDEFVCVGFRPTDCVVFILLFLFLKHATLPVRGVFMIEYHACLFCWGESGTFENSYSQQE